MRVIHFFLEIIIKHCACILFISYVQILCTQYNLNFALLRCFQKRKYEFIQPGTHSCYYLYNNNITMYEMRVPYDLYIQSYTHVDKNVKVVT